MFVGVVDDVVTTDVVVGAVVMFIIGVGDAVVATSVVVARARVLVEVFRAFCWHLHCCCCCCCCCCCRWCGCPYYRGCCICVVASNVVVDVVTVFVAHHGVVVVSYATVVSHAVVVMYGVTVVA